MAELYYPDIYFSNIKENILTNQKKETFEDKTSNIKYEDNVLSSFYYLNLINNYLSNKTKIINGKMIKVKKSRPLNVTNDVVDILIDDYFEFPVIIPPEEFDNQNEINIKIEYHNIIIMSQSCDLVNNKIKNVVVCPIYSLNELGEKFKSNKKDRLRLLLPYREHLAQSFARFFMRIGLPIDIPEFK